MRKRRRLRIAGLSCFWLVLVSTTGCNAQQDKIWDEANWNKIQTYDKSPVICLSYSFSPDGKNYVAAGLDGKIRIFAVDAKEPMAIWDSGQKNCRKTHYSPDGTKIASLGDDPALLIWDVKTQKIIAKSDDSPRIYSLSWSPDGTRIASYDSDANHGTVWAMKGNKISVVASLGGGGTHGNVHFSPSGNQIAMVHYRALASVFDGATYKEIAVLRENPQTVNCLAYSADGKYLATGGARKIYSGRNVVIWDTTTLKSIHKLYHSEEIFGVEFLPDNRTLQTSDSYYNYFWTMPDGRYVGKRERLKYPLDMAVYSRDGQHAITMDLQNSNPDTQHLYVWERLHPAK